MNSVRISSSSLAAIALALLTIALLIAFALPARAQTESVLYSFAYGPEGGFPLAGPMLKGTSLYGTASQGGYNANGTVWAVNTITGKETTLYEFQAGDNDGYTPMGGVALYKGSFYGTTCGGPHGTNGGPGMVFKLTKSKKTYVETVLHVFDTADGACPTYVTPVFDKQGNLYGTTSGGGSGNSGTLFKLTPNGTLTILHNFCNYCPGDGQVPQSGVTLDKQGNMYGTTQIGGTYSYGTLYEVTAGGTYKILYNFMGGDDGLYPLAPPVLDKKGNLYGTTENGGAGGYGTVWQFNPKTGQKTILHDFVYQDGQSPWGGALVFDKAGNLYGTTSAGGTVNGSGTIFKLAPDGTLTTLYSFSDSPDGDQPYGSVVFDKQGTIYTTTTHGGATPYGAVIKLTP
ncbi:MAG TPA: choice-of-anchor tandem repeat GloVer-containing protein [Terriglobales bacterium]|nr:choice-of-anchor tandem repeat GloVer-containing protein [Terriglobales bacterium]